jgi:short subunit fatty acids transporter
MGLSASAVMVGYMAKHHADADYRLLVAVSYFGMGATWHAGPSGSVPLLLATENNFLINAGMLSDVIPLSETTLMPFNLIFTGVVLLHWSPRALGHAAQEASGHLHGIVLQFPLYAGMFGLIKHTAVARKISDVFISMANRRTLPLFTFWYSGILNYFVPSGGSKWAIEAPYLVRAAQRIGVPLPRVAMAYAYGDMSTNLIQPFWAIPLLSVAKLEFRDILGFEIIAFVVYSALTTAALLLQ